MDFETNQWDLADQDFYHWLNGDNSESNLSPSDILKSTYLAFRQSQIQRLSSFCKQAFEYYIERKEKKFDNNVNFSIAHEQEEEFNIPMFRKSSRSFWDIDEWTRKNNDKIINGIVGGNQEVINDLYEYEFPKVVDLIIKNSGSVEIAKDVFQDGIVILIEKVYAKRLDLTCSVKTYLYSICKYLWFDQLRRNKREKQMIDFFDEEYNTNDIFVHFYNTPDIFENVSIAINTLGDPCKLLLECYYYQNLSWEEIADKLGYANAASARNQKYKCLERIRKTVNVEVE
jgi:RNA polymerase sigma factor (sigma-70 family)